MQPVRALGERWAASWRLLLAKHHSDHPLLDLRFIEPALRRFSVEYKEVLLAVGQSAGEPAALALVSPVGLGRWELFMPSQLPFGPMLVRSDLTPDQYGAAACNLLKTLPGAAWSLALLRLDPRYAPMLGLPKTASFERISYAHTVDVAISGKFDDYWNGRSRRLRQKMRRLIGGSFGSTCELVELRDPLDMPQAVQVHGELECSGWKGRRGTAISDGNVQGLFYRDVLDGFSRTGSARVYQLRRSGEVIASQFALEKNGLVVLLKTAYQERNAKYSPGRMLDYLMLETLFREREADIVEYCTKASDADRQWATCERLVCHVNVYRSTSFGRLASSFRRARRSVLALCIMLALGETH